MVLPVRFFIFSLLFLFSFLSFSQPKTFFFPRNLEELKEENPTLYNFEKRLKDIYEKIQKIIKDYQKGKISRKDLKNKLRVLLKEEIEIINNPEYMVEQKLEAILYNLPQKTKSTSPIEVEVYPEK